MFIRPKEDWIAIIIVTLLTLLIISSCHAEGINEANAIHAILGEARGEGYIGMYAVACAIRNRGTLHGVYGAKANISDATRGVYQLAAKAWNESEKGPDVTNRANFWENVKAFGEPSWVRSMECTAVIGHHRFFRPAAGK